MLHLVQRLCACLFLQIFFCTRTIITFSLEHLFVFVVFALTQFCFLFLFLLENFFLVWLCFNTYTLAPTLIDQKKLQYVVLFSKFRFLFCYIIYFSRVSSFSKVVVVFVYCNCFAVAALLPFQSTHSHTHTIKRFLHPPPRRRSRSTSSFFVFNG